MKMLRHWGRAWYALKARQLPERVWSQLGLGVVVAARNRAGWRAANCLRTLRRQTMPPDMVDLTLVDYGSEPEQAAQLQELCLDWRVRYVWLPVADHGSRRRGHALNCGLRLVPEWCRYAVTTDIDMLYAPNFLEWVVRTQYSYPDAFTVCRFRDLPEGAVDEHTDVLAEFDRLRPLGELYDDSAVGPCLAAPRKWWFKVRGFDERMGGEDHDDTDVKYRAQRDHRVLVWLHEQTAMLHQWHWRRFDAAPETPEQLADAESYRRWYQHNQEIADGDLTIIRNRDHEWGQLPDGGYVIEAPERRR